MGKPSTSVWATLQKKRWPLMILLVLSVSTVGMILVRSTFDSCTVSGKRCGQLVVEKEDSSDVKIQSVSGSMNPLSFMKSKLVLLVSHELSLSGDVSRSCFLWFLRCFQTEVMISCHFRWSSAFNGIGVFVERS